MTCRVAETGICYFLFERSSRSTFNNYLYKFFVEFVYPACFTVSNKIITGCAAQYPLQHKKKAAIHLTDTRQYPQLFLFVDYECIFLSDFALLKSVVRQKRGFGSQRAFPHFARSAPIDFALLKSAVRQKRGFGSQRAFPHFVRSAPTDFATAVGSTKHL